jgi:hypothetical protein
MELVQKQGGNTHRGEPAGATDVDGSYYVDMSVKLCWAIHSALVFATSFPSVFMQMQNGSSFNFHDRHDTAQSSKYVALAFMSRASHDNIAVGAQFSARRQGRGGSMCAKSTYPPFEIAPCTS